MSEPFGLMHLSPIVVPIIFQNEAGEVKGPYKIVGSLFYRKRE